VTVLTFGATLYRAWEACQTLEGEYGVSCELIDGRSLVPFNYEKVVESVKKTGALILASDACEVASYLHNVASKVTQMAFDYLDAPPAVVGARNWIVPPAELEEDYYPQPEWLLDAYHTQIKPLSGYTPTTDRTPGEMLAESGRYVK
jgi:2-oxoisovalerate dehydrogenase E1 component